MDHLEIGKPQQTPPRSSAQSDPSIWRRWFIHLSWMIIPVSAAFVVIVGVVLIAIRDRLTSDPNSRAIALEIGVNMVMFGSATVLITVIASVQLEHKLLGRFSDRMNDHVVEVRDTMHDVQQEFTATIEQFIPLFGNCAALGLEDVFLTRSDAFKKFGEHLKDELKEAEAASSHAITASEGSATSPSQVPEKVRLWIVASSMKGILETASAGFDGAGILTWAADLASRDLLDLHVLLTHPSRAAGRADQEHRVTGAIDAEIIEALKFLQSRNVPSSCIKMALATPTVFAVATRQCMLLNPYPYGAEAYRSFTMTVKRVHLAPNDHPSLHRDIFEQYEHRHFILPWTDALELPTDFTIPVVDGDPALSAAEDGPA